MDYEPAEAYEEDDSWEPSDEDEPEAEDDLTDEQVEDVTSAGLWGVIAAMYADGWF